MDINQNPQPNQPNQPDQPRPHVEADDAPEGSNPRMTYLRDKALRSIVSVLLVDMDPRVVAKLAEAGRPPGAPPDSIVMGLLQVGVPPHVSIECIGMLHAEGVLVVREVEYKGRKSEMLFFAEPTADTHPKLRDLIEHLRASPDMAERVLCALQAIQHNIDQKKAKAQAGATAAAANPSMN
jgi:hypothetical protein